MHRTLRPIALAAFLLLSRSTPGAPANGFITNEACSAPLPVQDGELYVVKTSPTDATGTDLLFNVESKGEGRAQQSIDFWQNDGSWAISDVWRSAQRPREIAFSAITFPDGLIDLDSDDQTAVNWAFTSLRRVGDSLPVGTAAGIGLVIPGDRSRYAVQSGALSGMFPQRLSDGGVRLAFAPLAEINSGVLVRSGCTIAGRLPDTADTAPNDSPAVAGHVIGYNVYRMPACTGTTGSGAEAGASLHDASSRTGSVAFVDLRKFRLSVPNDGASSPAANDLDPSDGVELVNPDGVMYSGDEVLLVDDRGASSRTDPWRAPRADQDYWYAVQPVWRGSVAAFADVGWSLNQTMRGDHRRDVDGDGTFDAVDVNLGNTTLEFISPQADPENGSIDGLGLTHDGEPFVGPAMFAERIAAPIRRVNECFTGTPRAPGDPRPPHWHPPGGGNQ